MNTIKYRIALLFICFAATLSCSRTISQTESNADETRIDSLIKANRSIDSLQMLLGRFVKEGNQRGELAANSELGTQFRQRNDFLHAIACHKRSLDLAIQLNDTVNIIKALNNLGTNYRRLSVLEEATSYHYKALEYSDAYSHQNDSVT